MCHSLPLKSIYNNKKNTLRLFYKVYLQDIYRLGIPTILLKPRDGNDPVEL